MDGLIAIAVVIILIIVPIKIAAKYVGAQNTGAFMCLLAIIFAAIIQKGVSTFIPQLNDIHPFVDFLVSVLLSAIAYMMVLGTSYVKGIIIALLQIVIMLIIFFLISLIGIGVNVTP